MNGVGTKNASYINYDGSTMVNADPLKGCAFSPSATNPRVGEDDEESTLWVKSSTGALHLGDISLGGADGYAATIAAAAFTSSAGTWADTCDITCRRIGEVVSLSISAASAAMDAAALTISCPAGTITGNFRANVTSRLIPVVFTQNAVPQVGKIEVNVSGALTITVASGAAFTNGVTTGWSPIDVTYIITP